MPKKQTISNMVIEADHRRTALTIEGIAVKLGVKKKANGLFPTRFMDRVIRCTGFKRTAQVRWNGNSPRSWTSRSCRMRTLLRFDFEKYEYASEPDGRGS